MSPFEVLRAEAASGVSIKDLCRLLGVSRSGYYAFPKRSQRPSVAQQHLYADAPHRVCVSDITYISTALGWCYLATVVDMYSRRVVGWALAEHMRAELVARALHRALNRRKPDPGLVFHSDRGSQYASARCRALLPNHKMTQSRSGAVNCYDKAPAESFFASLKKECTHLQTFTTPTEAYDAVAAYIDGFDNPVRRHSALDYLSPTRYEQLNEVKLAT